MVYWLASGDGRVLDRVVGLVMRYRRKRCRSGEWSNPYTQEFYDQSSLSQLFDATGPITETKRFLSRSRVNYAENMLLGHPFARSKTQLAIISCVEPDSGVAGHDRLASTLQRTLTFNQLYLEVAQAASGMRKFGVRPGDCIAALTSNNAETVIYLLAASSLGAVFSSVAPEFGVKPVLERFLQVSLQRYLSASAHAS